MPRNRVTKKIYCKRSRIQRKRRLISALRLRMVMTSFLLALRNMVEASIGMAELANKTDRSRESLHKTLSDQGNPHLSSIRSILRLFRILYAGFAGLNEFSRLSALLHSPKMFAVNICIQNPIEPILIGLGYHLTVEAAPVSDDSLAHV